MKINSLYVTQSAVIGLSDAPLEVKDNIRKAFKPIFKSKNCFADEGVDICSLKINETFGNAPFICHMGQLRFNERSVNFFPIYSYDEESDGYNVFGCDRNLKDQRMNFLYFELHKPFKMLAQYGGKTVASGKIFLHVYPTGYIVVHLAVYRRGISGVDINTENDLLELIQETKPWIDGKWKWKSKFGCHPLKETFMQVFQSISMSVFSEGKMTIGALEWKAGVSIATDLYEGEISREIMDAKEGTPSFVELGRIPYSEKPAGILVAKKKIYYYFAHCGRGRNSILHSFWKINYINEFLLYKSKVYSDYLTYIQKDMNKMRDLKLNKADRLDIANIIGKDFYKNTFFTYTQTLDEYTKMLGPRYRAIYALFSKVDGFDDKRAKLNQELKVWKNDIENWNSKDTDLEKLFKILLNVIKFLNGKAKK